MRNKIIECWFLPISQSVIQSVGQLLKRLQPFPLPYLRSEHSMETYRYHNFPLPILPIEEHFNPYRSSSLFPFPFLSLFLLCHYIARGFLILRISVAYLQVGKQGQGKVKLASRYLSLVHSLAYLLYSLLCSSMYCKHTSIYMYTYINTFVKEDRELEYVVDSIDTSRTDSTLR